MCKESKNIYKTKYSQRTCLPKYIKLQKSKKNLICEPSIHQICVAIIIRLVVSKRNLQVCSHQITDHCNYIITPISITQLS